MQVIEELAIMEEARDRQAFEQKRAVRDQAHREIETAYGRELEERTRANHLEEELKRYNACVRLAT